MDDMTKMTFEDAMTELETIVRQLEEGKSRLEDSIALYERGVALRKHCETRLREARLRVEKIALGENGQPIGTQPLDGVEES
ncbi:MAG: exodeoxyribonuclease VII small subunit [Alphaproteobacteria bacterium GWF2_58_20]|nr:MAG: exodeoxyribonuclease VII small subunit [Alphaproteobacteria bacterium GWF2_58_20]